jgi:hypothetical protein
VPLSEYSRIWFGGTGRTIDLILYGILILLFAFIERRSTWIALQAPSVTRRDSDPPRMRPGAGEIVPTRAAQNKAPPVWEAGPSTLG